MTADRHLGEAVQDLLDGRLSAAERAAAEAHLAGCAECARELDALRVAKDALARARTVERALPPALASAISAALDREAAAPTPPAARLRLSPRPAIALGLLVLVGFALATVLWRARREPAVPAAIARAYVDYRGQKMPLELRTANTAEMEEFFAAHGIAFPTHVYDLGMMGFRLVGGRVHGLPEGRPSALFAYEAVKDGVAVLCDMYAGRLEDLPPPAETRENEGIRFDVHRQDGLTMVFWEEGDIVCVLVSDMPADDVIKLAFAKAMKPRTADLRTP
jgi:anti-sigma factor RsiW